MLSLFQLQKGGIRSFVALFDDPIDECRAELISLNVVTSKRSIRQYLHDIERTNEWKNEEVESETEKPFFRFIEFILEMKWTIKPERKHLR